LDELDFEILVGEVTVCVSDVIGSERKDWKYCDFERLELLLLGFLSNFARGCFRRARIVNTATAARNE